MKYAAAKANRWEDHFTRLARKERYPARSVYKLQEIQKRFCVIRAGARVLDLGCAPGSWLLYAAERTGSRGLVLGIDLIPVTIPMPAQVSVRKADVFDLTADPRGLFGQEFDVVLSDMAPATTGSRGVDAARSYALCEAALAIARRVLLPGGAFVCKIFQGADFKSFTEAVRAEFAECRIFKPQSCRKASKEIYLIGKGKKAGGPHVRS
jgi:23S rRNA (uridine2552-2'-O)-methyltransferase